MTPAESASSPETCEHRLRLNIATQEGTQSRKKDHARSVVFTSGKNTAIKTWGSVWQDYGFGLSTWAAVFLAMIAILETKID
jgi:hypothetical protein